MGETGRSSSDFMDVDGEQHSMMRAGNADELALSDSLQPVALLMDQLKNDETGVRVEAMERLQTIALALGAERTRSELLPFLLHSCLDEEDEVLAVLSDQVGRLVPDGIGGIEHVALILPLLEGLLGAEEPVVRQHAVASLEHVVGVCDASQIVSHVIPVVQRLASGDWHSKRMSAVQALPFLMRACQRMEEQQSDVSMMAELKKVVNDISEAGLINQVMGQLALDDMALVRKCVASTTAVIVPMSASTLLGSILLPILERLAEDPQDSVRLQSVEAIALMMMAGCAEHKVSLHDRVHRLVPIFLELAGDESWRIRFMVATHFAPFASSIVRLGQDMQDSSSIAGSTATEELDRHDDNSGKTGEFDISMIPDIHPIFVALLGDVEAEVRCAAASQISAVAVAIGADAVDPLLSSLHLLIADGSAHVRSAVALQLNDLSRVAGSELAMQEILPMILQLLRDESSEVRLNVISRLEVIVEVVGIDRLAESLLPAIVALVEDGQWRVRQTIVEYLPDLASHLGQQFFVDRLFALLLASLKDAVYAVRLTAVDAVARLVKMYGSEWSSEHVLKPIIAEIGANTNYLKRQVVLFVLSACADFVDVSVMADIFVPLLVSMSNDAIANVRLNAAKACGICVQSMCNKDSSSKEAIDSLMQVLQRLEQQDQDVDVKEQAAKAIAMQKF